MAASTVPAAKQYILDMLRAIPSLNEAAITWDEPNEQEDYPSYTLVYFVDPVVRRPQWSTLGGAPLEEEYVVTLEAKTRYVGDDRGAAEVNTWALLHIIETALRGDLRLGGTLFKPMDFDEQECRTLPLSDGWFGHITAPLIFTARI